MKAVAKELASRAADEAQLLPPEGKAQLLEEREGGADKNPEPAPDTQQADQDAPSGPLSAVVKGEKNLERYIVKRVAPYLKSKVEVG